MNLPTSKIATPPAGDWIELAERRLREAGHRASMPRSAVLELIGGQECVLSAREIADGLRAGGREVGVATVYRTLEVLEGLRLVQRLDVGGGLSTLRARPAGGASTTTITSSAIGVGA